MKPTTLTALSVTSVAILIAACSHTAPSTTPDMTPTKDDALSASGGMSPTNAAQMAATQGGPGVSVSVTSGGITQGSSVTGLSAAEQAEEAERLGHIEHQR